MKKIPWWYTEINSLDKESLIEAFNDKCFSSGPYVRELEQKIADKYGVPYTIVTNSGTSALTIAYLAIDIKPEDEVIVPALTWIATAQAASIQGSRIVLADCLKNLPIIDPQEVKKKISRKTKAIVPVHLNGRGCDIDALKEIAYDNNITLIEDTCKGMFSLKDSEYLGSFGDIGCFSMSMISLISIGYGGFLITKNKELYEKMVLIRDHGVNRNPEEYRYHGSNFKISDILASLGISQIERIEEKIRHVKDVYIAYQNGLADNKYVNVLPVDIESGEVPLYTEALSDQREEIIAYLAENNVDVSRFHRPLNHAEYMGNKDIFPNAEYFSQKSFILPSGPSQSLKNVDYCIDLLNMWKK